MRMFSSQDRRNIFVNNPYSILCQFVGLQNSPVSCAKKNMTPSHNFSFGNRFENVWWSFSSLWILRAFPRNPVSVLDVYLTNFVKLCTIPVVESKNYARMNMFGVINALGALQDGRLKNDHPLRVSLPILYTAKLH